MKTLFEQTGIIPPFTEPDKEAYIERLKKALRGRVNEAYLFGSITGDRFNQNSDIDLILVVDTHLPFFERHKDFKDLYSFTNKIDLLIYTPAEITKLKTETIGFWKSVWDSSEQIV